MDFVKYNKQPTVIGNITATLEHCEAIELVSLLIGMLGGGLWIGTQFPIRNMQGIYWGLMFVCVCAYMGSGALRKRILKWDGA